MPSATESLSEGPLQFIDLAMAHPWYISGGAALILLVWAVAPMAIARSLAKGRDRRARREKIADRYRGLITRIIALPLVMIPLLAYIDGYLQSTKTRRLEARTRFEESYRESAKLLNTGEPLSQLLGLQAINRLLEENPTRSRPITQALAMSAALVSPHSRCKDTETRLSVIAESLLQIVLAQTKADPGLQLEIAGACLRGAHLPEARLNEADLSGTDLSGSDLYAAQLHQANLRFADVSGSGLVGANLSNAGFNCTTAEKGRNFAIASRMEPEPKATEFRQANLDSIQIANSLLTDAILTGLVSSDVTIEDSCMSSVDLHDAHFFRATLRNVDLSGAKASGLWFNPVEGAEIAKTRSALTNVSFQGAELRSAQFRGALLDHVSFSGANLADADFSDARDLSGALVSESELRKGVLCNTRMPNGHVAQARESCESLEPIPPDSICRVRVKARCERLQPPPPEPTKDTSKPSASTETLQSSG